MQYQTSNSDYQLENPNWHIQDAPWKASQIYKLLTKNSLTPNSIVEIGCGSGEVINNLSSLIGVEKDCKYVGYDIAPDATKFWENISNKEITFYHEDLLSKSEYYDLLLMIDVFEHVDDYLGFIKKAGEKAEYKIYHIPLDISVLGFIKNRPQSLRNSVGHIHYFFKDYAISSIEDSGQKIIDYFYTPSVLELEMNRTIYTHIINIARKLLFKISPDFCVKLLGGYSLIVLSK